MSRLKNPTLRNRTEELCEHANSFEVTFQIGCELQNIGGLIKVMAQHIRDLQDKVDSQADHIKGLLNKSELISYDVDKVIEEVEHRIEFEFNWLRAIMSANGCMTYGYLDIAEDRMKEIIKIVKKGGTE